MNYPSLADDDLLNVLQLVRTQSVGVSTFFTLVSKFGSAGQALAALPELARKGGGKKKIAPFSRYDVEKEVANTEKFGGRFIVYGAEDYPSLLLNIPDPPPVIVVRGSAEIISLWQQKPVIALVGARNASAGGCQMAHRLAKELGELGVMVVSGLARGIDSFAHKGALATGTIGVIAGGIDNVYPPENASLYQQLFEKGAVISEQPFASLPFAGSFPSRNRIIAGMSLGIVVVEASPKSGSLITARLALEYNREIFAVPGTPLDPRSRGCNQLIRQGAILTETADDIIATISGQRTQPRQISLFEPPAASFLVQMDESEMDNVREKIAGKLSAAPISIDELIEQAGVGAATVQGVLLELELAGRLRRSAGNQVAIVS